MKLGLIGAAVAAVVALFVIFGSFYTVDQGEEAVLITTGAVSSVEGPGLHFKLPFVQSIRRVSTQSHVEDFDAMESYSRDQQPAAIDISVTYRVPPGSSDELYAEYGTFETMVGRLIQQRLPAIFKNVFGQYDALSAIQQRAKLNSDALAALQEGITGPVVIESVQIKDIKFSPAYEAAIEAKQTATVEVQRRQQELAQQKIEAEITVTKAQAQADSQVAAAKAQAQATELAGLAEASAIKAKGDALRQNPELIALTQAERWNGQLPYTMVPGGALPFLNLGNSPAPAQ